MDSQDYLLPLTTKDYSSSSNRCCDAVLKTNVLATLKAILTISSTVSQVQPDHGHNKIFRRQHPVLGEPQHQALQNLVADGATRLPQQRPQVVARRLPAVVASFELLESYLYKSNAVTHNLFPVCANYLLSKIEALT